MSRPNPAILFGFFVAVIVAMCGAALLKGGLYLGKHEGDTFHLLEIVFRIAEGDWPHLDFITPIGALAFWPISLFVALGFGIGHAIILGQGLVAALLLPAVWWAASSRLRGLTAPLFGLFVLVMVTALVYGDAQRSVSISMHYNRWAWAISFVAIVLALCPPRRDRPRLDGLLIGACMFALAMIKITYFGAFALPVALALALRGAARTLLVAVLTGLVLAGLLTAVAGVDFWWSYLTDLAIVAASDVRPYPSEPFSAVLGAPAYMGASLMLVFSVILLRQGRRDLPGLILLLLAPGFVYVTYQNHGNDPQWLLLLGILLLANVPVSDLRNGFGWDMRTAIRVAAGIVLAMATPSFLNLAYSPFRHLNIDETAYVPLFVENPRHDDLFAARIRAYRAEQRGPLDVSGTPVAAFADIEERIEPTIWQGEPLPVCSLELGMIGWFQGIVDDLEAAGLAGPDKGLLATDLFSSHWLFGDFRPLKGGAPWYYGGLPGLSDADYVLVPLCPVIHEVRDAMLTDLAAAPFDLTELRRTKLYILYGVSRRAGD